MTRRRFHPAHPSETWLRAMPPPQHSRPSWWGRVRRALHWWWWG